MEAELNRTLDENIDSVFILWPPDPEGKSSTRKAPFVSANELCELYPDAVEKGITVKPPTDTQHYAFVTPVQAPGRTALRFRHTCAGEPCILQPQPPRRGSPPLLRRAASVDATGVSVDATGTSVDATGDNMDATGASVDATGASVGGLARSRRLQARLVALSPC
eukprot:3777538-Pyramimonas_sp.AAC.1